jgi:hypothetical protein
MGIEMESGDVSFSESDEEAGGRWVNRQKLTGRNKFFDGIHAVYITFLSMQTKDLVEDLYSQDKTIVTVKLFQYLWNLFIKYFGRPIAKTRTM